MPVIRSGPASLELREYSLGPSAKTGIVCSTKEFNMILVVGATGLLGTEICLRLAKQGEKVRALVRTTSSPEKMASLEKCGVELCVGDLKDAGSLSGACNGVNAVISTASSTLSRQAGDSIESVDDHGQLNLVEAIS